MNWLRQATGFTGWQQQEAEERGTFHTLFGNILIQDQNLQQAGTFYLLVPVSVSDSLNKKDLQDNFVR